MLSNVDAIKANEFKNKFIENTQRILGFTNVIITRISSEDPKIRRLYEDVPSLLDFAKSSLSSMGETTHVNIIIGFIKKILDNKKLDTADGVHIWHRIHARDDSVLVTNLNVILPENPFIPRIQFIYGNNPDKIRYVSDKEIGTMWNLVTALIHNAVKYVVYSGNESIISMIPRELIEEFKIKF